MAQSIKSFYAIALLIASVTSSAFAIRCYKCDSNNDFNCRNSLNRSREFLLNCAFDSAPSYLNDGSEDGRATACMVKTVEEDGVSRVIRSCYWGNIFNQQDGCRNPPWATYETSSCYVCGTAACNSEFYSNSIHGYEISSSSATESIAVLIVLFGAVTRWMS